ncbi:MAG: hypothetical protein H0T39_03080 [Actinobacteria bacterium]|nr:hypothetical protein [Actinomycetota bacterium]
MTAQREAAAAAGARRAQRERIQHLGPGREPIPEEALRLAALRSPVASASTSDGRPLVDLLLLGGLGLAALLLALAAAAPTAYGFFSGSVGGFLVRQRLGIALYGVALFSSTALVFLLISSGS